MQDVIEAGKWQMDVLKNGLSLDLKEIPSKYAEKNNVSAEKNMSILREKVEEWQAGGYVEHLTERKKERIFIYLLHATIVY